MKIEIQIKKNMIHFREDRFQIFTISLLALEPKCSLLPHLQWIWSKWCQLNIITGRGNPFPYIWNLALQTKIPVILSISSSKITIIKFIFAFGFSSSSSSGPPPFLTCFAVLVLYSVHWVHVNNASLNPWEIFNFLGKLLKRNIFHRIFFRKRDERVLFQHFHWKRYRGGLRFQFYSWTTLLSQNSNVLAVY